MSRYYSSKNCYRVTIYRNNTMNEFIDDVVVSGISGRFPESDNLWEFRDHLLKGDDMVTEDDRRWPPGLWGLPLRNGKLKNVTNFDATFFGVHAKQANSMDPQLRMLLEVTFEAIIDAGINPQSLRGTNTGVYIGLSTADCEQALSNDPNTISGYELIGYYRCMYSNRISFTFDLKGPSVTIDTGSSASLVALCQAIAAIKNGECDCAIVGGSSLCINPITSLKFQKLGVLAPDGKCRAFDSNGTGYARSEAVVAILLQPASIAKRIYASIIHCKYNNDGYKPEGQTFPSGKSQELLLRQIYTEAHVNPTEVIYVEAHGTGTKVGDPEELRAISNVFCEKRSTPLLIGSVKSNMGHAEAAAGLCGLAKIIVATECGVLPANLHYHTPNSHIAALKDGRLKVVTENTKWKGGLVGINSIGFGGCNAHAILRCFVKDKEQRVIDDLRIFACSGRSPYAIDIMLSHMQKNRSKDIYDLLYGMIDLPITKHSYRGFTILNGSSSANQTKEVLSEKQPVWFVFSGMGSQWQGMGVDLLRLDIFRTSLSKSNEILKPYNVDLYSLITNPVDDPPKNVLQTFVSVVAIQIGLVDLLRHVEVNPDGMVGHSLGEICCAYADGCLTHEQTILCAYWRGKSLLDINCQKGLMAAVGLTWDDALKWCPQGVEVVCHNGETSVTVSGEKGKVKDLMDQLAAKKIFVREVDTSGIAFHSRLVNDAAPIMSKALQSVIPDMKARSSRWITTSIPQSKWNIEETKWLTPAYFVNNLISPVYFHEAFCQAPKNAVVIEIAPHGHLLALLRNTLGEKAVFLSLMKRNESNSVEFLLKNLGRLYISGVSVQLNKLYPTPIYPVPYGTSMISPLIRWDHLDEWHVAKVNNFLRLNKKNGYTTNFEFNVSSCDSHDNYLTDYVIDGRNVFPASALLVLAWKGLADCKSKFFDKIAIEFKDIVFERVVELTKEEPVNFQVNITEDKFTIKENDDIVCTGHLSLDFTTSPLPLVRAFSSVTLNADDVYKTLWLKGYEYGTQFRGIVEASIDGTKGKIQWMDNWVSFIDNMFQFSLLSLDTHLQKLPSAIRSFKVDPKFHLQIVQRDKSVAVKMDSTLNKCVAGGIQIRGIKMRITDRQPNRQTEPILEEYHFVPFIDDNCFIMLAPDLENRMTDYYIMCASHIRHSIKKRMQNQVVHDFRLELIAEAVSLISLEDDSTEIDMPLINFLKEYSTWPLLSKHDTKSVLKSLLSNEKSDILLDAPLQSQFMKPLLDIVRDNFWGRHFKVTEVHATGSRLAQLIVTLFEQQPLIEVDYVISGRTRNDLPHHTNFPTAINDIDSHPLSNKVHLLVGKNVLCKHLNECQQVLKNIYDSLKNGGFALLWELKFRNPVIQFLCLLGDLEMQEEDSLTMLMEVVGFKVISFRSDGFLNDVYLIRKVNKSEAAVLRIDESNYDSWIEELKKSLSHVNSAPVETTLWLVSNDQPKCGIAGLVSCLVREDKGTRIRCIFNSSFSHSKSCVDIAKDILVKDLIFNVYRDGKWGFFTHLPFNDSRGLTPAKHALVNLTTRGDLSTLSWFESPLKFADTTNSTLCYVYYATVNFRDVLLASGKMPLDALSEDILNRNSILGMEFSGQNINGERVMGLLPSMGLATSVEMDPELTWLVPENWTLEDAATIPVAYVTVYYALVIKGQLQEGEAVLIHSASGGVGQAAIHVATSRKCSVFATVGSKEKREFLKRIFPQLTDDCFGNSRDDLFEDQVLVQTKGKGVDVILDLLSHDKFHSSVRCLAQGGRFLEIGNSIISSNVTLGVSLLGKNVSFHGIYLHTLFDKRNANTRFQVAQLIQQELDNGTIKPLNRTVFDEDQLQDAFRFVAGRRQMGKVIIKIRDEIESSTHLPPAHPLAKTRCICHPSKSYVIIGGLEGLGIELVNWLVRKGAKFLMLVDKSDVLVGYQALRVENWKRAGVDVRLCKRNTCKLQGANECLKEAIETQGPIGGIFNVANILSDDCMENQSVEKFKFVCDSKILITKNLDCASRNLCPSLDWFVVFTSVITARGTGGQTNLGFANSTLERLCEFRQHEGVPALAVQWGAVEFVEGVPSMGTLPQNICSSMNIMEKFLCQSHPIVSSYVSPPGKIKTPMEAEAANVLLDKVNYILGVQDIRHFTSEVSMSDLGMDSIMGIEIKQTLEKNYDLSLSPKEIRHLTVGKIISIGQQKSKSASSTETRFATGPRVLNYNLSELIPKQCIIKLNSINLSTARPIFIVHPIEGNVSMFKPLAKRLYQPVFGIQFTSTAPRQTLSALAEAYVQEMQHIQPNPPYNLAGYSMGCSVVFEMALKLQNVYGPTKAFRSIIFLEGSHNSATIYSGLNVRDLHEFQVAVLLFFLHHFTQLDYTHVKSKMSSLVSLSQKLDYISDTIVNLDLPVSRLEVKLAANLFYSCAHLVREYTPSGKLKIPVTLVRAVDNEFMLNQLGTDYSLGNVCDSKVRVEVVEGDHNTFLQEPMVDGVARRVNLLIKE